MLSNVAGLKKEAGHITGLGYMRTCERTSRKGTWNGYDGRFPVDRIKNSVLKRPAPGQPFVARTEGAPFRREGTDNGAGRVSLGVCPIYTATASETADSLSLLSPLSFLLPLPWHPSGILARTSPRCIVGPLGRSRPIGPAHDDFIMKKRNVRVDRTPF